MDPVAFNLGSLSIHWYGVFMATAVMLGMWTASRRGLRENVHPDAVYDLSPWIIVGAVVGARSLFIVTYWKEKFAGEPLMSLFAIRTGFVFYGGLIAASLAVILFCRVKKLPLWKMADILAPSVALGHAFGRIGCLFTGCCHGKECSLPWGIEYPAVYPELHGKSLHPTQIYESLLNFALYAGLAWLYRRKKFDGHVFATYLVAYAILRSCVEMFRGDYEHRYLAGFITPAHLVSVGILAAGIILFWKLPRKIEVIAPSAEESPAEGQ